MKAKLIKTFVASSVLALASAGAFAQTGTCAGGDLKADTVAKPHNHTADADTTCYIANSFTYNISANVGMKWVQNTTAVAVMTANTKGRNNFSGSSEGGAVKQCGAATSGSTEPTLKKPDLAAENGCPE